MATNKRTQKRGTCPYCLKHIAITASGNLADHGYRNINGYKATNSCFGSTRHHLGHISAIEEMKNAIALFYDFMLNSKDAKSINITDFYDRTGFSENIVHKVRNGSGKQLHKF